MLPFSILAQKQNWSSGGWQIQGQLWLSDLARVTESHGAQCVEGMFLTPTLTLYCMVFLRNKNNNSSKSAMNIVQAWQKMDSIFM